MTMTGPEIAKALHELGYEPLPLPAGKKKFPPSGTTGYDGVGLTTGEIEVEPWDGNMAIRVSGMIVGIDVDVYHGGGATLTEWEDEHGKLPPTWMTSARDDLSGIRLFRVPAGSTFATQIEPGIEIVQWFHRYCVVFPSTNPDHGDAQYRWIDQSSGEISELPPPVDELPELPWKWIEALTVGGKGRLASKIATSEEVEAFVSRYNSGAHRGSLQGPRQKLETCGGDQWGNVAGGRHDTGMKVACWLLREARAGLYPASDAVNMLSAWWGRVGKSAGELDGILRWATAEAIAEDQANIDAIRRDADERKAKAEKSRLPEAWVDRDVAQLMADDLRGTWAYVGERKRWLKWDGRVWAERFDVDMPERARQWVGELMLRAMEADDGAADHMKKAVKYQKGAAWESLAKHARGLLAVSADVLDQHHHLLNTTSGIVDLRTGKVSAHESALMITKMTSVGYDPDASHPDLDAVLECMDPPVRATMQEYFGIGCTGYSGNDNMAVLGGQGSNGKSTVLLPFDAALGSYAGSIPPELIVAGRDDHKTVFMTLRGLRFGYIEETAEDGSLRLERVKALTGGKTVEGRVMHGDMESFSPTHTLAVATNHRPVINSAEKSVWRRLRLIPFPYTYGGEEGDRAIDQGLRSRMIHGEAQREAMLAWAVQGAVRAFERGEEGSPEVHWCEEIMEATEMWKGEEDVIARFVDEVCVRDPHGRVKEKTLYESYVRWCHGEGRHERSAKNFHRAWQEHEYYAEWSIERRKSGDRFYGGLRELTYEERNDPGQTP